jgi:C1A family cysteine protease
VAIQRGRGRRPHTARPAGFKGTIRTTAQLGWKPDLPDPRDVTYAVPARLTGNIQPSVDLRDGCPTIYDQGRIGSCVANAIAGAMEFDMIKQGLDVFTPSRLFIYYNGRVIEGYVDYDSGLSIRDGVKSVVNNGDCPESGDGPSLWTYDDTPPPDPDHKLPFPPGSKPRTQPPQACFDDAIKHTTLNYRSVAQNLADMQGCLTEGYPFAFGFSLFSNFPSFRGAPDDHSGDVPMPPPGQGAAGGHAMLVVGYDNGEGRFICRNSWGSNVGDAGYFYMPYAYLLDSNVSRDFWTIRLVQ